MGLPLEVARVRWLGVRGLRWANVYRECCLLARWVPDSVILVVHAGGNDLGSVRSLDLTHRIKQDLARCFALFRNVSLIWSEIVSRPAWCEFAAPKVLERARRKLNKEVFRFMGQIGGFSVRHTELEGDNRVLMRPDGVHLSDIGLDIFLEGLRAGVEAALAAWGGRGAGSIPGY